MKRDRIWNCHSENQMFRALIGNRYGENPEHHIDTIRKDKQGPALLIQRLLELQRNDRLVDLGSGTGFVTRHLAPVVERIYCLDISEQFFAFASQELAEFANVSCHLIENGNLSPAEGCNINKVFSIGVFIHFCVFDVLNYMEAVYRLLPKGGMFLFEFADGERLDIANVRDFVTARGLFNEDRKRLLGLMNWNGLGVIRNLAKQVGFEITKIVYPYQSNCVVLLVKS
jgi:SAM-dependent methyltransferase